MKIPNTKMKIGALAMLCASTAVAQEAATEKTPPSSVDFSVLNVAGSDSYKFGEYTGLKESGAYVNGGFRLFGGDGYGTEDGTRRWDLWGTDLGLTSRAVGGSVSDQGRWRLGVVYDQLRHYTSDSYQTPYTGTMGGNSFTLPTFGLVANTRTMSAAQIAQFQTMKISNDRENTGLMGDLILSRHWSIKGDFNRLEQSGAKLMGFGSANFGGANPTGERISILPMPQNYRTDTLNLGLNWIGEKAHATLGYFGSYFRDNYNGVSFQTWAGSTVTETMGTPPSNDLHQVNLTGGYAFTKRTKLAGGLSYGRNTQNTAYAYDTAAMVTPSPTNSLNGSVRTTHADLKLTDQTTRDLMLSAGFKYDHRDNQTSSNIYNFRAISGGNIANYPNAPISIKKSQAEVAADYRLSAGQKVRLAYNHDDTHRYCNDYASGGGTPAYAPGTNCVTVPRTKEDKVGLAYRLRATDGVNLNAAYAYSDRESDRDLNARPPMIGFDGNPTAAGIANTPAGTGITGLNGGEFIGFNPFFEASRKQHMVKAGTSWDAGENVSVGLNGRYTYDGYETTFGMQRGRSWGVNLDGTYRYVEEGSITAYATHQQRTREMTNEARSPVSAPTATVPAGATWNNTLRDTDTTVGLNVKHGGFMGHRLTLLGDIVYSRAKSFFDTSLNYALLSGAPCSDPSVYTCVGLPDITSELWQFKVRGEYQLTKSSKATIGYWYQRLKATDFYYNGLQTGFTPTSVLPTNQTAPSYSVNVITATWTYNF